MKAVHRLAASGKASTSVMVPLLLVLLACVLLWLGLARGAEREEMAWAETVGNGISTSATAATAVAPAVVAPEEWDSVERVDVVVWGSTSSGLGALRGLRLAAGDLEAPVRVALLSNTSALESPLAQGLCVEDDYRPGSASGFYGEFRRGVLALYRARGVWPLERNGRLVYEPEVAEEVLTALALGDEAVPEANRDRVELVRLWGRLCTASDAEGDRHLILEDETGHRLRLETRYFIDASPEADLARALGCDYTIGRSPLRYNDVRGRRPQPPARTNLYTTSPQALTLLLTLSVGAADPAPAMSEHERWLDPPPQPALPTGVPGNIAATFPESWSMRHILPGSKRELNEAWSDCPDAALAFSWYMEPGRRPALLSLLQQRALRQAAQLQEAFPSLGVACLPDWPYVRGEIMVPAERVFTLEEVERQTEEPIARGTYAAFDRHDPRSGTQQPERGATVLLPLEAVKPRGHPYLLVSTAFSVDYKAYNSALRMEPLRANAGAACGALAALALAADAPVAEVEYAELLSELEAQGHVLGD